MYISKVFLENFRNFAALELDFNQGFVVIAGPNGAGKTNFLESLYFGSTLRRFPESSFQQLFMEGSDFFRVRLAYEDGESGELEAFFQKTDKSYRHKLTHNSQPVTRQKHQGFVQVVSFLPQDLSLLARSPGGRRRYLDEALSLTSSEYRHALSQYQKALKQRNGLLQKIRDEGVSDSDLSVWNEQFVKFGSTITRMRREFMRYINANIVSTMNKLSPNLSTAVFTYKNSGEADEELFLQKLEQVNEQEKILGTSVAGPHRDDFESKVSQKAAVGYVSRGELRAITLALKILEKNYTEKNLRHSPVLLLDDVFSEFDESHQKSLIEFLHSVEQVFITTANLDGLKNHLPPDAQIHTVGDNTIKTAQELAHELAQ